MHRLVSLLLATTMVAAGCVVPDRSDQASNGTDEGPSEVGTPPSPGDRQSDDRRLALETLDQGQASSIGDRREVVVRDQGAWEVLWD